MSIGKMYRMPVSRGLCFTVIASVGYLVGAAALAAGTERKVVLPERGHPSLACTAEELGRLRQAYRGPGPERDIVAARVKEAERFVGKPIEFPPRGGQHNQ